MVRDYSEQANSVRLVLAQGDIDFVVAGSVTGVAPSETLDFDGREILLEATEEILAKKLFFRAALLKPRDVFDLVAASMMLPAAAKTAVEASASRREAQLRRLNTLAASPPDQLLLDIVPIGDFTKMVPTMINSAMAWIESAEGSRGRAG